jgi:hypothetical protein
LKVWFPQKPPVRFRERATIVLMTGVGWEAEGLLQELNVAKADAIKPRSEQTFAPDLRRLRNA